MSDRRRVATASIVPLSPAVTRIGVVVPAHDEAATIAACLDSLERAAAHRDLRSVAVEVVVVLDRCTDDTGRLARVPRQLAVTTLEVDVRNVGRARRAGLATLLARRTDQDAGLWLASTDADSTVPRDWLARQLAWRRLGADAVAGTVRIDDWTGHPIAVRHRFEAHQARLGTGRDHSHVHGANLSFSAAAYLGVGGMPPEALAEDHALWLALHRAGYRTVAPGDLAVTTSARRDGRARGGFSTFLTSLDRTAEAG